MGVGGEEESFALRSQSLKQLSELRLVVQVLVGVFDEVRHVVAELGNGDGSALLPVNVPPLVAEVVLDLVEYLEMRVLAELPLVLQLNGLRVQNHVVGLEVAWVSVEVFGRVVVSRECLEHWRRAVLLRYLLLTQSPVARVGSEDELVDA